jgi:putative ABC transport system permease protein
MTVDRLHRTARKPHGGDSGRVPRSIAISLALFHCLSRAMPRRYRFRHGDAALELMTLVTEAEYRRAGVPGVVSATCRASLDLICRLPIEYFRRESGKRDEAHGSRTDRFRGALESVKRDLSYALRSFRRQPLSNVAATGTLAIGIGLNAAVFSVIDWVLLRPLPYPSSEELVRVFSAPRRATAGSTGLTYSEFSTFSRAKAFRAATAFSTVTRVIAGQGLEPSHVVVARVAGDFFATFGVFPQAGRAFARKETDSAEPVVVVSDALWRGRFGADPAIVGRTITIDSRQHTIVGLMPARLGYPRDADVWRPLSDEEREDDDRENVMIGRLVPDASVTSATAELATMAAASSRADRTAWVEDAHRADVRNVRGTLAALLASAGLILLLTCANVAALLGARSAQRIGEMMVRRALGASRGRLVRQLLTESLLLAGIGGAAGLVLGRWTLDVLVPLVPGEVPRLTEIALDGRIVGIGTAATLLVGVVVGLAPAFRASRFDLRSGPGVVGSLRATGPARGRRLLVAAQTAMAVVLTIGAGLLARSLQHFVAIDHGFEPAQLAALDLYQRGTDTTNTGQLYRDLIASAEELPGVRSAAVAWQLPTRTASVRVLIQVDGVSGNPRTVVLRPVTPRYFETAGVALIDGRPFRATDERRGAGVAIVNSAFLHEVLGGRSPLGVRVHIDVGKKDFSIVGVASDVTPGGEGDRAALYVPVDQMSIVGGYLLIRTRHEPEHVIPALTARLRTVAPGLALDRIRVVAETLEAGRAMTRFDTHVTSAFAALALLLAAIGVYGLTAGEVSARWRELAVRLALGAPRRGALWAVMRSSVAVVVIGMVLGLAAAIYMGRWMRALLHGIDPADPPTLIIGPLLLATIGLVAASLAARGVLRADPAATLRAE